MVALLIGFILLIVLAFVPKSEAKNPNLYRISEKSRSTVVKTVRYVKRQIGRPYRYGGGHGDKGHRGFDCSGLASAVARRAGYRGPVVTTYTARAHSVRARGNEWLQWGIRPGHMVVKVRGVIYEAARSGIPIRRGVDRGYEWRVPKGVKPLHIIRRKKDHERQQHGNDRPHRISKRYQLFALPSLRSPDWFTSGTQLYRNISVATVSTVSTMGSSLYSTWTPLHASPSVWLAVSTV